MRTLDRALWKYSEVGDIWENEALRCHRYPNTGGPLGVTMLDRKQFRYVKQFRRPSGVETYVEVIKTIGIERVKNLYIKYGDNPLVYKVGDFGLDINCGLQWVDSGAYRIRNPGNIYRQAGQLKKVAKRLNIDLIIDYFK